MSWTSSAAAPWFQRTLPARALARTRVVSLPYGPTTKRQPCRCRRSWSSPTRSVQPRSRAQASRPARIEAAWRGYGSLRATSAPADSGILVVDVRGLDHERDPLLALLAPG